MLNPFHLRVLLEKRRRGLCVGAVLFHAQGQRIAAQPGEEGVLGGHDRTHVAHHLRAAFRRKRGGQGRIDQSVIAFVGRIEGGVAGIVLEVEAAAVDDHSAERRRVAVDIFCRGMDNDVCAEAEGIAEHGGGERVIDGEYDAVPPGNACDFFEIEHDNRGIGHRFGEDQAGFVVYKLVDLFLRRIGIEEAAPDPQLGQGGAEQVERAAVNGLRAHDVVARLAKGRGREQGGGHARRTADPRNSALQGRELVFQRRHRGIGQAGIKVSLPFKVE